MALKEAGTKNENSWLCLFRLLKEEFSYQEFIAYVDKKGVEMWEVWKEINIFQEERRKYAKVRGTWWYRFFSRFAPAK